MAPRQSASRAFAFIGVGLVVVCLWSGLKEVQPAAKEAIEWKESAAAGDNPAPAAPPIDQYGPVAATMVEKTYRRTLTLPPEFVQRIGADGLSVLSPYLVDPTAENVLKLVDSFKRTGQDVSFTREVTREDEAPMSFDAADIGLAFHRLQEQAYSVEFAATYTFSNSTNAPVKGRFLFVPPQGGGTIQGLKVEVGGQEIPEPDQRGVYSWTGQMKPGETRRAVVKYKAEGARAWSYDLGSSRRRVKAFALRATVDGSVQFRKGSIQPSSRSGNAISWKLTDVVTSQQLALAFPRDVRLRESFLQALATLPATLILFGLGVLLVCRRLRAAIQPAQLAFGLIVFGFGLGATMVLANYVGPIAAVFIGPLAGGILAGWIFGWRSMAAILPIALFPAASLSPENTGLWVLILAALGLAGYIFLPTVAKERDAGGP